MKKYFRIVSVILLAALMSPAWGQGVPDKRAHHELVFDEGRGVIVMTAGSTTVDQGKSYKFFNDMWTYDGTSWKIIGNAGDERSGIRMVYHSKDKKIYSYGGYTGESEGELRVLEGDQWRTVSDEPAMKVSEPGFVCDSKRNRLVAFGGSAGRGLVSDATWEWGGSTWKRMPVQGPPARQSFAMVYDSKRNVVVAFGGMGSQPDQLYNDTWEYDGASWKKVSDSGPEPRSGPGFAYDSKRGMLVIFGGFSKTGMLSDTWGWDGKVWKKLSAEGPAKRVMGYLAYDSKRDKVVLFGGRLGWPNDANDTWEWDGVRWQEKKF